MLKWHRESRGTGKKRKKKEKRKRKLTRQEVVPAGRDFERATQDYAVV